MESPVSPSEYSPLFVADPSVESPATAGPVSPSAKALTLIAVVAPGLGLVTAIYLLWGWGFRWADLALLLVMYVVTVLGITVGFHRLFTHRAFETHWMIQFVFAVLGSMAVQGPLLQWVALHRRHHQHSDKELDPHSPHHRGSGTWAIVKGLCHAHLGWLFSERPANLERYVGDLSQSKVLRSVSALFPVWVAIGMLIPAGLGWLLTGSTSGTLTSFIWGGLVRILFVHHVTWSINSVCHIWGRQPFHSNDESRNNFLFGFIGLGEGWHNTHHAFPTSARHGLLWWELDASYWIIRGLELTGLAWNVKLPTAVAIRKASRV